MSRNVSGVVIMKVTIAGATHRMDNAANAMSSSADSYSLTRSDEVMTHPSMEMIRSLAAESLVQVLANVRTQLCHSFYNDQLSD